MIFVLLIACAIIASAAACSSSHGSHAGPPQEIPCAVNLVLQNVCQQCHAAPPKNEAPFPLVTYDDTQRDVSGKPLWTYMKSALEAGRMPAPPVELAPADRDTLIAWLGDGAPPRPEGTTCP